MNNAMYDKIKTEVRILRRPGKDQMSMRVAGALLNDYRDKGYSEEVATIRREWKARELETKRRKRALRNPVPRVQPIVESVPKNQEVQLLLDF